jgi:heme/copper-type cytochrome/quinol oxidase subunit 2
MSRKDRRYQRNAAKGTPIRKQVKANKRVLIILAIVTFIIVVVTYNLRYSGAI